MTHHDGQASPPPNSGSLHEACDVLDVDPAVIQYYSGALMESVH
jgi:hypothetical protein